MCEGDTLARMGGDEFGIMLCDIGATGHEAMERAEIVGQKIMSSVNQACFLDSYVCHMNSSIGVTFFDATQKEVEDILRQADIAMYHAKKADHNILHFFGQKMQDAIIARTKD